MLSLTILMKDGKKAFMEEDCKVVNVGRLFKEVMEDG